MKFILLKADMNWNIIFRLRISPDQDNRTLIQFPATKFDQTLNQPSLAAPPANPFTTKTTLTPKILWDPATDSSKFRKRKSSVSMEWLTERVSSKISLQKIRITQIRQACMSNPAKLTFHLRRMKNLITPRHRSDPDLTSLTSTRSLPRRPTKAGSRWRGWSTLTRFPDLKWKSIRSSSSDLSPFIAATWSCRGKISWI